MAYGIQRDLGAYAEVKTSVMSGFDGFGRAFLQDQNSVVDQVERNKTALMLEAALNNLIAIRTGSFVF